MTHDDSLDRTIDEIARGLTEGAPRPGFSGRVGARLETGRGGRRWVWQLAGAAAVLALAAYLTWPGQDRQPTAVPVAQTPASAPRAAEPALTPRVSPAPPTAAPVLARATTRPAVARPRTPNARMRIAIDADAPQLDAISVPVDLTVKPLEIAELTVPPLEPEKESR